MKVKLKKIMTKTMTPPLSLSHHPLQFEGKARQCTSQPSPQVQISNNVVTTSAAVQFTFQSDSNLLRCALGASPRTARKRPRGEPLSAMATAKSLVTIKQMGNVINSMISRY
jgi:hypothetical protein